MENGETWDIDLTTIAVDRASYYACYDNPDKTAKNYQNNWKKTYNDEYEYTMEDEGEAIDWACNNMNWEDVEPFAVRVDFLKNSFDYNDGWTNGDKEIITKKV